MGGILLGSIVGFSVVACSDPDSPESILEDYRHRVESVTGVEASATAPIVLSNYPSHRDRVLAVTEQRLGARDFFQLYQCDIFRLVNERNSLLGKVMPVSQRLLYEVNFLRSAEICYGKLKAEAKEGFLDTFEEIMERKRADLPKIFWNATFDSPEMQKAFSLAVEPWDPVNQAAYLDSLGTIEYFRQVANELSSPTLVLDSGVLENHYFNLQRHRFGGALFQAIGLLTETFDGVAGALEQAMAGPPICPGKRPSAKGALLQTIFNGHYMERIQPQLSLVHRYGKRWLTAINELIDSQEVQRPPAFEDYRAKMLALDSEVALWGRFRQAVARHTQAWRALLGQCGLL